MEQSATRPPAAGWRHRGLASLAVVWVVAVTPLAGGLFLAGRWRMYEWAVAFGVFLLFAVLGSGLLLALAEG
jgi:FtsH-binding integral membrane protein